MKVLYFTGKKIVTKKGNFSYILLTENITI